MMGAIATAASATMLFVACNKENSSSDGVVPQGKQSVSLFLTDAPGYFDNVYIDIQSVQVLVDTCDKSDDDRPGWGNGDKDSCKVWEDLQIRAGVYDLLQLRNGIDTLLASGVISEGKVRQIKIEIGNRNSLVKDSITYPLNLPGDKTSLTIVLKLKGNECERYAKGKSRLWLDFDVQKSIFQLRNNAFYLNPVIRWFIENTTASLQGSVKPQEAYAVISVYNGTDTAYALPGRNGEFKVRGLTAGTYSVFVNASNGYQDTTINSVVLGAGDNKKLNAIQLHK
ncbi:lipoprotein [Filimonas lacunae]|nr:lipoprotein [Filimonas lacunae]